MAQSAKTALVTGASKGIGAGLVNGFLARGYNVVANSRSITRVGAFEPSNRLALIDGDIADPETAQRMAATALDRFGSLDALVNNAGIFFAKPFLEYTAADLHSLIAVNLNGFFFASQHAINAMLSRESGGSIVNITSTMVQHPIAPATVSLPMITKGGIEAATRNLALEYAKFGIRINAVAPGIVDTPMHQDDPPEALRTMQPMGRIARVSDIVAAVLYLTEAEQVTGEVLRVDGGAHVGKW